MTVRKTSEKNMVATGRAAPPVTFPPAAAAAARTGSSDLEKTSRFVIVSLPRPASAWMSPIETAVTPSAPTIIAVFIPVPLHSKKLAAAPQTSTTAISSTPLRTARRTTPVSAAPPLCKISSSPPSRLRAVEIARSPI